MQNLMKTTEQAVERFERMIAGFNRSALAASLVRTARDAERRGLVPSKRMIEMAERAQ